MDGSYGRETRKISYPREESLLPCLEGEMSKPPAFQFYPGDWLSSTRIALMTPAEEGAYIRLLCHAWADPQCSLPNDDDALASLSRLGEGWFNESGSKIKGCFKVKGNRLVNERLKIEREKQKKWLEKSRLGGIHSGKSRKVKALGLKGGSHLVQTKDEPKGNTSSSSSSSSSLKDNTTLSASLEILRSIPNYPFDEEKDRSFLRKKEKDYPEVDILALLKGWESYLLDAPLNGKSRPHAQLNNQFEFAMKWGKHRRNDGARVSEIPEVTVQEKIQRCEAEREAAV
jgi:uncharacterized protein YdaU (DUF1376 family)